MCNIESHGHKLSNGSFSLAPNVNISVGSFPVDFKEDKNSLSAAGRHESRQA